MKKLPVSEILRGVGKDEALTKRCAIECVLAELPREQFWNRIVCSEDGECWPWIGEKDKNGYGRLKIGGVGFRAHRLAFFLVRGTKMADLEICHSCDNPACCNPEHLFAETHQANMADRDQKRRQACGERNGRAKLTAEIVAEIRSLHVPYRVPASALAKRFGVNIYVVRDIINRVTWKGIEASHTGGSR